MVILTRTEHIHFSGKGSNIPELCHYSKNLFNTVNYKLRNHFFESRKLYQEGIKTKLPSAFELMAEFKDDLNYKALPAQTSQQIIKVLCESWKAYRAAHKAWAKDPSKFLGEPRIPKYKDKNGRHILVFTNQQCKIIDSEIVFPQKVTGIHIKTRITEKLCQVRIIPQHHGYICEIVYERDFTPLELESSRVIGIDVGLTNVVTVVNNFGHKPFVVKGGFVKGINQYYNKEAARLRSIYDRQGMKKGKEGSAKRTLTQKRNRKITDAFHKISRMVVNYAINNHVGLIIIGKNELWKQGANMGRKNNQNFVQIPHAKLIDMIKYKAEEVGIGVETTEEAYTSKCSFLDHEPMKHHVKYMGKRFTRGLFRSSNGTVINADVNGAYNIIRKVIPDFKGIEGAGLHPVRVSHEQPNKNRKRLMCNNGITQLVTGLQNNICETLG